VASETTLVTPSVARTAKIARCSRSATYTRCVTASNAMSSGAFITAPRLPTRACAADGLTLPAPSVASTTSVLSPVASGSTAAQCAKASVVVAATPLTRRFVTPFASCAVPRTCSSAPSL
jgi:hypothetical protein